MGKGAELTPPWIRFYAQTELLRIKPSRSGAAQYGIYDMYCRPKTCDAVPSDGLLSLRAVQKGLLYLVLSSPEADLAEEDLSFIVEKVCRGCVGVGCCQLRPGQCVGSTVGKTRDTVTLKAISLETGRFAFFVISN